MWTPGKANVLKFMGIFEKLTRLTIMPYLNRFISSVKITILMNNISEK